MGWGRIDDDLHSHPKVLKAGLEAMGLWALCLSWTSKHLTDGHIPQEAVETIRGFKPNLAKRLVDVGLWERAAGGYQMHDFHDRNPAAKEQKERRSKWREKKQRQRGQFDSFEDMSPGDNTEESPGDNKTCPKGSPGMGMGSSEIGSSPVGSAPPFYGHPDPDPPSVESTTRAGETGVIGENSCIVILQNKSASKDSGATPVQHSLLHEPDGTDVVPKKPKRKTSRAKEALVLDLPPWLPGQTWAEFVDHRREMETPLTDRAAKMAIKKLNRLRAEGNDPQDVLEQSIMCGWTGIFAVKDRRAPPPSSSPPLQGDEQARRAWDEGTPPPEEGY